MSRDGEGPKGGRPKKGKAKPHSTSKRASSKSTKSKKKSVRGVWERLVAAPEFPVEMPDAEAGDGERSGRMPTAAGGATGVAPERRAVADSVRRESLLAHYRMLAEVATSFWYLKTKHFKKEWDDDDLDSDDPRERRALGRLAKGMAALAEGGTEVQDPTNSRYPEGGEGWMKPIQLAPTAGITFAYVTETVRPVVYYRGDLIQRGEVFVAVPVEAARAEGEAGASDDDTTAKIKED